MAWDPTDKITDFGDTYESMLIPATSDVVLGEDDPGGTPVAISAMASYSAQGIAKLANNTQFLKKRILTEDLILTVNNLSDLTTAQAAIDEIGYIEKDVTLNLSFGAGATLSGTSTNFPITFSGIGGVGGHILVNSPGSYTLTRTDDVEIFSFENIDAEIRVYAGTLVTTANEDGYINSYTQCRHVWDSSTNDDYAGTGDVITYNLNDCYYFTPGSYGTGYYGYVFSHRSNIHKGSLQATNVVDFVAYDLDDNSSLTLGHLDIDDIPTGSTATGFDTVVNIDETSTYRCEAYGGATPGKIIFPSSGGNYISEDVNRFLSAMPKRLDADCTLVLPDETISDTNAHITISGFWTPNNSTILRLEAEDLQVGNSNAQTTILDSNGVTSADYALEITDCDCHVTVHSIKLDVAAAYGLYASNVKRLTVESCYITTAAPSSLRHGMVLDWGTNADLLANRWDECGGDGVRALRRAYVWANLSDDMGGSGSQPTLYGYYATQGGVINASGNALAGDSGVSSSSTDAEVRI